MNTARMRWGPDSVIVYEPFLYISLLLSLQRYKDIAVIRHETNMFLIWFERICKFCVSCVISFYSNNGGTVSQKSVQHEFGSNKIFVQIILNFDQKI